MFHSVIISSKMENKTGPFLYCFYAAWFNLKVLSRTSKRKYNDNTNKKHPMGKAEVKISLFNYETKAWEKNLHEGFDIDLLRYDTRGGTSDFI